MIPVLALFALAAAAPAPPPASSPDDVTVKSDELEFVPGARTATARGQVTIRSARFEATAATGEVSYAEGGTRRVERLVLTGDVKVRRLSDGLDAVAQEATYTAADGLVVMTGEPLVTRGRDRLSGTRIALDTGGDRVDTTAAHLRMHRRGGPGPAELRADRLLIEQGGRRARGDGHVQLREGPLSATADKLDATLAGRTGLAPGATAGEVEKALLSGNVRARRGETRAEAGEATWEAATGDLVLTKGPAVSDPAGAIKGARIVIRGDTGAARVESAVARVKAP